jgi:hypothetical protein
MDDWKEQADTLAGLLGALVAVSMTGVSDKVLGVEVRRTTKGILDAGLVDGDDCLGAIYRSVRDVFRSKSFSEEQIEFAIRHGVSPNRCNGVDGPLWPPGAVVSMAHAQAAEAMQRTPTACEMDLEDLADKRSAAGGLDDICLSAIEIVFDAPAFLSPKKKMDLLSFVVGVLNEKPNLPQDGIFWLKDHGPKEVEPDEDGIPNYDYSTLQIRTQRRPFLDDHQRQIEMTRRVKLSKQQP